LFIDVNSKVNHDEGMDTIATYDGQGKHRFAVPEFTGAFDLTPLGAITLTRLFVKERDKTSN
jgi:hypothetical protein